MGDREMICASLSVASGQDRMMGLALSLFCQVADALGVKTLITMSYIKE